MISTVLETALWSVPTVLETALWSVPAILETAILALMAQKGFATVSRGRGGSRITETGQKMWENNQITK